MNKNRILKYKSACTIQKYLKGLGVKQRFHMLEFENRVLRDLDQFTSQISVTKDTCANLIRHTWHVYKRIQKRKAEELAKAKAKKKADRLAREEAAKARKLAG
jgi:methylthioribose-1-phosphate isomerase